MALDSGQGLRFYQQMLKIRMFEEQVNQLYMGAKMPGLAHLYSGQEAIAVGVCEALRTDDYITSTHRGHGHCLAKGASLDGMFAELLGKKAGYCGGKGGSMASDQVAACFFGEGALGQGLLYEVMNMASLWQLPIIFVCENNMYNEYTHYQETTAGTPKARAEAFGISTKLVDGQDVKIVYSTMMRLVQRARQGKGPSFVICNTYRFFGHHVGDVDRSYYRSREEEDKWKRERDPIKLLATWLSERKIADGKVLSRIESDVCREIEAAVQFALNAPYPDLSEVDQDVYA
jgi:pyruvate dehydrogenase E1 component alpha subunit